MKFFQRLYCRLFGHFPAQVPAFFFCSRYGPQEIGTLQCKRCGAMTGRYNRNMAESIK
jgi:RAB protein geranylgeranyltransferase component A